jgi:hypothetical protein
MSLYDRVVTEGIPAYSRDPRLTGWKPKKKATGKDAKDEKKLNEILKPKGYTVQWMEVEPDHDLFAVWKGKEAVGQVEWFRGGWEVDALGKDKPKIISLLRGAGLKVKGKAWS